MTNNIITKYGYDFAGAVFASAFTSKEYKLTNYKYIDFIVVCGAGTEADITVKIFGKNGETEKALAFRTVNENGLSSEYVSEEGAALTIGGDGRIAVYRITADDLAKDGFASAVLKLTAAEGSTVIGSVITVCYEPRYSE